MPALRLRRQRLPQETGTPPARSLRDYQISGFERFKDLDRFPICMEMRLGKSLLCVRWLRHRFAAHGVLRPRILLVAPTTPLLGWLEELSEEGESALLLDGSASRRGSVVSGFESGWLLAHYGQILVTPEIGDVAWDAVILDESTSIKNPSAKTTKRLFQWFGKEVKCKAILTGLISPQSEFEFWPQLAWLFDGQWMDQSNFWKWRDRVGYRAGFSWKVKNEWRPKIKAAFHEASYVLTRAQAKVGPIKIRQVRSAGLPPEARRIYRNVVTDWEVPGLLATDDTEAKYNVVIVSWLRRITGGHIPGPDGVTAIASWKYAEITNLLSGELFGQQCVVWCAFNAEVERVTDVLGKAGISATYIHGTVSREDRSRRIIRFRSGLVRVIVCQIACGRFGLNLSTADTAIYFSNSFSYESRRQSEDRIIDVAKTTPRLIIDLITKDTVDEDIIEGLRQKKADAAFYVNQIMTTRRMG